MRRPGVKNLGRRNISELHRVASFLSKALAVTVYLGVGISAFELHAMNHPAEFWKSIKKNNCAVPDGRSGRLALELVDFQRFYRSSLTGRMWL